MPRGRHVSRAVERALYEELIREEVEQVNIKIPKKWRLRKSIGFYDAVFSHQRRATRIRFRVYRRLRLLGYSLPAIAKISGYDHTTVLWGVRVISHEEFGESRHPALDKALHKHNALTIIRGGKPGTRRTYKPQIAGTDQSLPDHIP